MNNRGLVSSIIYPILTMLPIILLLQKELEDNFYISKLFILATILLVLVMYPLYRIYCYKNRFEFEAAERVPSRRVIIFSLICSLLISTLLLEAKGYVIFISIPLIMVMLFTYWITSIEVIRDEPGAGFIKVTNNHLNFYTRFIQFFVVAKMLFLISVYIWDYYESYLFLSFVLSFTADFFLLITLRNLIYSHNLRQEGVNEEIQTRRRGRIGFVIFFLITCSSVFIARSRSIFSYEYIGRFINWLDSLAGTKYRGEVLKLNKVPKKNSDMMNLFEFEVNSNKYLEAICSVLDEVIIAAALILIVIFVFYPLLSPLFKKNSTSFKDYYRGLIKSLFNFYKGIKDFIDSLFSETISEQVKNKKQLKPGIPISSKVSTKKKKREMRKVLRLYIKVLNWAARKRGVYINNSLSVTDIFRSIPVQGKLEEEYVNQLSLLFNRAFFSPEPFLKSDYRMIKATYKKLAT